MQLQKELVKEHMHLNLKTFLNGVAYILYNVVASNMICIGRAAYVSIV